MHSVTAIIPAFNEERTIGDVIKVLQRVNLIDKIIVVSDGSVDSTVDIAKKHEVEIVELRDNIGKGGALRKGVDASLSEIMLFVDADLIGLKEQHIVELLLPILKGEVDMTIGVFKSGRFTTDLAQRVAPYLSGQRAIKRYIIENIPNIDITRFGVEIALTKYVTNNNIKYKEVFLENLTHVMKEEKLGLIKGFASRLKMYWDIVKIMTTKER
ncbi:Glycosyl transferase family 2 [Proteiniborus ethanoligenes]|uniref:Glucosyl-3-phosphoglycerate synthase n=1 Tax=Proteiniborus ethanoligenes TaxID=415015 RepID=A0A1H3N6L9_9FIRM|nr:glycosyltransferase family 2 protein [Proteiniborus ethanoligenes]TAH63262.1 MAG: glycosyltransferase family 2 protein [Gottschalkiaceae bacterium]SDY84383.1 Glycosyl transferase family 2 [Proteiniborus ethanoligenes]